MEKTIEIITTEGGVELYNTIASSIQTHSRVLDEIKQHMETLDLLESMLPENALKEQYNDYRVILEFNALLNISMVDLGIISRQLYLTKVKAESAFYVKHAYTIIYAVLERYEKQISLVKMLINKKAIHLDASYRELGRELTIFKQENGHSNQMKTIRNGTTAHVESFLTYYTSLISLDSLAAFNTVISFVKIVTKFIYFSNQLLKCCEISPITPTNSTNEIT